MNKKDFAKKLNDEIKNLPLKRQIELLERVKNEWLPEMIQAKKKKEGTWVEPEKRDKYLFCHKCHKYTLKTRCKFESVKETKVESTFRDSGYGDGDRDGLVERIIIYGTCPLCGHKQQIRSHYVRTIREWNRKEGMR